MQQGLEQVLGLTQRFALDGAQVLVVFDQGGELLLLAQISHKGQIHFIFRNDSDPFGLLWNVGLDHRMLDAFWLSDDINVISLYVCFRDAAVLEFLPASAETSIITR